MNALIWRLRQLDRGAVAGLLLAGLLASCNIERDIGAGTGDTDPATAVQSQPAITRIAPDVTLVPTLLSSVSAAIQPTAAPSPQLPTAVATVTPDVTAQPTDPPPSLTPSITPTPTEPPPTFTPPPPPPAPAGEHLIFDRPVPNDTTQWTDKTYPYGSTRGGTLAPHHGVEFAVPTGTPILAAAGGMVRVAGA